MYAEEMYTLCTRAMKQFVREAGFADVVVGLSGGIDSGLTAVMCVDAFGSEHVHGLIMPGPYSSAHSVDDASELADNLGIGLQTMSVIEAYNAFARAFEQAQGRSLEGLAAENTQARCRMVCLMALSNAFGWLMINTGNKSEAMMGYSTLYGDTAGAFAPLGGIYKTDVYTLARWRNAEDEKAGRKASIPVNSITKAPSAELAPGQRDESSLGISYARLDPILIALVEEGKSVAGLVAEGFPEEAVLRVNAAIERTKFKRSFEPPYPSEVFYRNTTVPHTLSDLFGLRGNN